MKNLLYIVLLVANALVLLGIVWPEGAPPFAYTINLATLIANVVVFAMLVRGGGHKKS
jgi:hypothetical protein